MAVITNPTAHNFHFPDWHGLVAGRTESSDAFHARIRAATKVAGFMLVPGQNTVSAAQLAAIQAHATASKWLTADIAHAGGLAITG